MEKAKSCFREGKYTEALQILKDELNQAIDERSRIQLLNEIGKTYLWLGQYINAASFLQKALNQAQTHAYQSETAYALNYLGLVYWQRGDNSRALSSLNESLKIRCANQDVDGISACLNNLGLVYSSIGDYDQALNLHKEQYTLIIEKNDPTDLSLNITNIGNIYRERGEYSQAFNCYQSAVEIDQQHNHKYGLARTFRALGTLYRLKSEQKAAIQYSQQSVQLLEELEMRDTTYIRSLTELTCSYIEANLLDEAKKNFNKAKNVSDSLESPLPNLLVLYCLGYIKQKERNVGESRNIFKKCLRIAEEHNFFDLHLKCLLHLAEIMLKEYRDSLEEEDEKELLSYLQASHELSVSKGIIIAQVRVNLLYAMLLLAKMDYSESIKRFEDSLLIAKEKKFVQEEQLARKYLARIQKFRERVRIPSDDEEFEEMMRYLREVQKLRMGN